MDKETEDIIKNIEDDTIKRASFLLFTLIKKTTIEESLNKTKKYLESQGWLLKTEDKDFIENIKHKSLIDIEKWIDFNLKKPN